MLGVAIGQPEDHRIRRHLYRYWCKCLDPTGRLDVLVTLGKNADHTFDESHSHLRGSIRCMGSVASLWDSGRPAYNRNDANDYGSHIGHGALCWVCLSLDFDVRQRQISQRSPGRLLRSQFDQAFSP